MASGRSLAIARRQALSARGRGGTDKRPAASERQAAANPAADTAKTAGNGRALAMRRRQALSTQGRSATTTAVQAESAIAAAAEPRADQDTPDVCQCGCKSAAEDRQNSPERTAPAQSSRRLRAKPKRRIPTPSDVGRNTAQARRRALAARGKPGASSAKDSVVQAARAIDHELTGRELAIAIRAQRSRKGQTGGLKSRPTGRRRPAPAGQPAGEPETRVSTPLTTTPADKAVSARPALTGTSVTTTRPTSGDLAGRCQAVTGTEYLDAEVFQALCERAPPPARRRSGQSLTGGGNRVTGGEFGRSQKMTGNESGSCQAVTGSAYLGAEQAGLFCGGPATAVRGGTSARRDSAATGTARRGQKPDSRGARDGITPTRIAADQPARAASSTLRGTQVTGSLTGRGGRVTGDEPGTCRQVTGTEYVGGEQYQAFCPTTPAVPAPLAGPSTTASGRTVTGTMTGRASRVTGDEPGTCKAITGTPYAGAEQYIDFCKPEAAATARARTRPTRRDGAAPLTGLQPSIGGKATGADKGACETISGTAYVGADQLAAACPARPAEPHSPDFPQPLTAPPWGSFSVASPAHAAQAANADIAVTGSQPDRGGVTGPFGMARGKVTGTHETRFERPAQAAAIETPPTATLSEGLIRSRVTGEGMEAGLRITGDDWDRGDRVTGTEGASAKGRNPTRRSRSATPAPHPGPQPAVGAETPPPVSKVTGGSGNTERGALVTYSGGARG